LIASPTAGRSSAWRSVDDATHEAVAVVLEHNISGWRVVRILEQICLQRGQPQAIRTDNGKEFCGRAMLTWHTRNKSRYG
jgi:hypothetical protein